MIITDARTHVRQFARDGLDSTLYGNADIDRAIQVVGQRFCRETRCLRRADDVTATVSSATLDISAIVTAGFRPEQLIDVYIAGYGEPLSIIDYTTLNQYQTDQPATTKPEAVAFPTQTTAQVYPTPDIAYALKFRWWERFTSWTAGDAAAGATSLNLPDDYLLEILTYGATATLQHNEKKNAYAATSMAKFEAFMARLRGAGTLGQKVIKRERRR